MKAYIIKIEIIDSDPIIWRKVILPAGATFHRLFETVSRVTNFSAHDPEFGGHLYRFDIPLANTVVTNHEETIEEHRYFQMNRKLFERRLKLTPPEHKGYEERYQMEMNKKALYPKSAKIDQYLEESREIYYVYDFGDYWRFLISLEEIVEDYFFGYPTLLDGKEDAPPEDVGGLDGFYDFLKAYRNPKDPGHKDALAFAESNRFHAYDEERINSLLKIVKYKKTEWDKIIHDNYTIVKDKYRKS